jgi:hypothetical protein
MHQTFDRLLESQLTESVEPMEDTGATGAAVATIPAPERPISGDDPAPAGHSTGATVTMPGLGGPSNALMPMFPPPTGPVTNVFTMGMLQQLSTTITTTLQTGLIDVIREMMLSNQMEASLTEKDIDPILLELLGALGKQYQANLIDATKASATLLDAAAKNRFFDGKEDSNDTIPPGTKPLRRPLYTLDAPYPLTKDEDVVRGLRIPQGSTYEKALQIAHSHHTKIMCEIEFCLKSSHKDHIAPFADKGRFVDIYKLSFKDFHNENPTTTLFPESLITKWAERAIILEQEKARKAVEISSVPPTFDLAVLNTRPEDLLSQLLDLMIQKHHILCNSPAGHEDANIKAEVKAMMTMATTVAGVELLPKNGQSPPGGGDHTHPTFGASKGLGQQKKKSWWPDKEVVKWSKGNPDYGDKDKDKDQWKNQNKDNWQPSQKSSWKETW